jgi:hypothetical protein
MLKANIAINEKLLGNYLTEVFSFYLKSNIDHQSNFKDFEKGVKLFLSCKEKEFKLELKKDLEEKKKYIENKEVGHSYFIIENQAGDLISVVDYQKGYSFQDIIEGFENFCQYFRNQFETEFGNKKIKPIRKRKK